jgi:hypothetical protein
MEMFLMAAVMSLLGVAVCAVLFAAATRDEGVGASQPAEQRAAVPQRFFASVPATEVFAAPPSTRAPEELVPVEALLLRIEQHIRLEQAAAEAFLHTPTGQSLQSRTTSQLLN